MARGTLLQSRTLKSSGSPLLPTSVGNAASFAHGFGTMEFYGHSAEYGGASDQALRGSDGRLAGMLHAEDRDRTKGGAVLSWHETSPFSTTGNGGWAHIFRYTEQDLYPGGFSEATELSYEGPGAFEAKRDYAQLWYGLNDVAHLGIGNLTPFTNALRAVISRLRAADIFEETDASVTYTGAHWGNVGGGAEPNKYQSGAGYAQTTTNGESLSIAVPSGFLGGTVALDFGCSSGGNGALWTFTVDGASAGTLDTRNVNAADTGGGANAHATPSIKRFTGLASGAHTIVATATTVNSAAIFDSWWIEARTNPLITVILAYRLLNYSLYAGFPYTPVDADVATLNTAIQGVVNEFDADVITVATDAAIGKSATYFVSDGAHLNDEGHALIAQTVMQALIAAGRDAAHHAAGNVQPGGLSRNPWSSLRNTIQAAQPDTVPLILAGRNAGDQTAHLTEWQDNAGNVLASIGANGLPVFPQAFYDAVMPWTVSFLPFGGAADAATKTGTWILLGSGSAWYNGTIYNNSNAQNDQIGWDFALAAGTWSITLMYEKIASGAIATVAIDGVSVGTIDTYAAATTYSNQTTISGVAIATNGKHRLTLTAATRNASASGWFISHHQIQLRRTA